MDTRWQADFGEVLLGYWDPVSRRTPRLARNRQQHPDVAANWEALFAMVDAKFLGYRHPETLVFRVTGHARRMRQGPSSAADRSLRMGGLRLNAAERTRT